MSTIKKFFPYSFGAADVTALITKIIVYICVPAILGAATWLVCLILGFIPFVGGVLAAIVGWALGVVSSVIGLYALVGIVLLVLDYLKVLKD